MTSCTAKPTHLPSLHSSFLPHQTSKFLPRTLRFPEFRFRNRRRGRLKLSLSFDDFLDAFVSKLQISTPLDLIIAPAVGIFSAASYFSLRRRHAESPDSDIGSWILFTNPTPFNRFVLLRCPTISFQDSELLEGVNERLVSENRHFVNSNSGRILLDKADGNELEGKLLYQRVCLRTEDGGVISLDYPANLDLGKEHGLDTTVLVVPGTPEGSMDRNVRLFVCRALQNGCFPVVMNPRGCAGSPVTTARLFTAADSDDICTAVQFINKSRPWTTLMSIGWGFGANMLTKYLSEVSERTPLTAAVCIDNPFDLEEATRSFPHHVAMDKTITGGLIDILHANKELFQGRTKGFNVDAGLSAKSVHDFDEAISMISYGYEAVEEFYAKSSTGQLVGRLKIPILDSDPTNALVKTSVEEGRKDCPWLSAVELALLKGHHPLLKDVDITINPSKGVTLIEGRALGSAEHLSNNTQLNVLDGFHVNKINGMLANRYDGVQNGHHSHFKSRENSQGKLKSSGSQQEKNVGELQQTSSDSSDLVKEEGDNLLENEASQSMQTAKFVMNMLDVTAPSALGEEQKKKVLIAMEQGETFIKALQEAVPEVVRGKLTAAVSDMVQTHHLNLDGLSRIKWIHNKREDIGETSSLGEISQDSKGKLMDDFCSLAAGVEASSDPNDNQSGSENPSVVSVSELQLSQKLHKSGDLYAQVGSGNATEENTSAMKDSNGVESYEKSQEKASEALSPVESVLEGGEPGHQTESGKLCITENADEQQKLNQSHAIADADATDDLAFTKEINNMTENEEGELTKSHSKPSSSVDPDASSSSSISATPGSSSMGKNEDGVQKSEDKNVQAAKPGSLATAEEPTPSPPTTPSIDVSQALDALTGVDDSTQIAVNNVFGVIENMIDQLEKDKEQDNLGQQKKNENGESNSHPGKPDVMNESEAEEKEARENPSSAESDLGQSKNHLLHSHSEECSKPQADARDLKLAEGLNLSSMRSIHRSQVNMGAGSLNMAEKKNSKHLMNVASSMDDSKRIRHVHSFPLHIIINMDSPYKEYLHKCFPSMIPNETLDLDSTLELLLEYFPEDGQWKFLDQLDNNGEFLYGKEASATESDEADVSQDSDEEKIIEPSYVILDNEVEQRLAVEADVSKSKTQLGAKMIELMCLIKGIVLHSLKVEVGRKLGTSDIKAVNSKLAYCMENVADEVAMAVIHDNELDLSNPTAMKSGTLHGGHVINTITLALQEASHLRKVLPVGLIVGATLAALRKHFHVVALHRGEGEFIRDQGGNVQVTSYGQEAGTYCGAVEEKNEYAAINTSTNGEKKQYQKSMLNKDNVMVGAVTAALGASALLAHHVNNDVQKYTEASEVPSTTIDVKQEAQRGAEKLEEAMQERNQNNIVASLAEKAMSVAAPVVPTKNDGGLDQERLVAMLADLGQRGGMLKLVGKVALLWGGVRGAMSLTDRLISFFHIAERPLPQRVLGFVCMVLVLWSPIVVPLLPTLAQNLMIQKSTGIAEYCCLVGLCFSVTLLVMLWGKRIRGYENPVEEYGLDLTSSDKLNDIFKGLMLGMMLVLSIHLINAALGCAQVTWPLGVSSSGSFVLLKTFGRMLSMAARGIVPAICVIVEELLFRSWLPEEVAVDLGYLHAIMISGLAFSFLQRYFHIHILFSAIYGYPARLFVRSLNL
ncbi:hypothetical protein ACLOJK_025838 [Asimina triloba]